VSSLQIKGVCRYDTNRDSEITLDLPDRRRAGRVLVFTAQRRATAEQQHTRRVRGHNREWERVDMPVRERRDRFAAVKPTVIFVGTSETRTI
jgi:hypothetical protein